MATLLWQRDIASDAEGVKNTFSGWDSCMTQAYWYVRQANYKNAISMADVSQQVASNSRYNHRLPHPLLPPLVPLPLPMLRRRMLLRLSRML